MKMTAFCFLAFFVFQTPAHALTACFKTDNSTTGIVKMNRLDIDILWDITQTDASYKEVGPLYDFTEKEDEISGMALMKNITGGINAKLTLSKTKFKMQYFSQEGKKMGEAIEMKVTKCP